MHAIKNQLILLIIIDLLIVLLFALRILNIIGAGLNYGVSGIILDMLVVILSAYIIKKVMVHILGKTIKLFCIRICLFNNVTKRYFV